MTVEQIRSFIAIDLPDELRRKLGELESRLKSDGQTGAKWVNPNSIHLTLKFLGNITADRIAGITGAIEEAAGGVPPFHLEAENLGAFPNLKRVQVVWVGIGGELDKLGLLQQRLESNLEPLGFAPEKRAFKPHLTLARLHNRATPDGRRELGELISVTRFETTPIEVNAINLMRSQLTPTGAVYSRLALVKLES